MSTVRPSRKKGKAVIRCWISPLVWTLPLHYINGAEDGEAFLTGIAPDHAEPSYTAVAPRFIYRDPESSDALRFACCVRVISTDGTVASDGARYT